MNNNIFELHHRNISIINQYIKNVKFDFKNGPQPGLFFSFPTICPCCHSRKLDRVFGFTSDGKELVRKCTNCQNEFKIKGKP